MECPTCKTHNPEGAKFCFNCGTTLAINCRNCGTRLLANARFCFNCGTPVATSSPATAVQTPSTEYPVPGEKELVGTPSTANPALDTSLARLQQYIPKELLSKLETARANRSMAGERRIVTVLFCDVKGSTGLAEMLDPEEWADIMNDAFKFLIEPIYRYEGTLARLMGDAILAFFGAPIGHEDDPQRAVLAGLDIVEGMKLYREQILKERGFDLNVRIGINTGLVVVGEVGSDLRVEYTAMGDAVNVAARMEQTAEPGTVQISVNTYKSVSSLFEFTPLGEIEIKGKAEPLTAYLALRPREGALPTRGIEGLTSPLVGRERELAALRASVDGLLNGRGQVVSVIGDAGLGKSRLVSELRSQYQVSGAEQDNSGIRWYEGRSLSYESTTPYAPFIDLLSSLFGIATSDPNDERYGKVKEGVEQALPGRGEELAPYLASMLGIKLAGDDLERVRYLEPMALRGRIFYSVGTLVGALASAKPLVLVFEDLHWTDPTSLELVEQLLPLADKAPLMLLALFRPQTQDPSWRLHEVTARDFAHRYTAVALQPLDEDNSRQLVSNLLEIEDLPEKVRALILSKAEGNPFFVEEVIRSLLDAKLVIREDSHWRATREIENIAVPDTLAGVITARLDRLDDESKYVAQTAAVIGREFEYNVLHDVYEAPQAVDGAVSNLQRRELVREKSSLPSRVYLFKHVLTQETAYGSVLLSRRRELHGRVAECLEQLTPERVNEISRHFLEARQEERALPYLIKAADNAARTGGREEASAYYRRAIDIVQKVDEPEMARRAYEGLGKMLEFGMNVPGVLETYNTMRAYGQERNNIPIQVSALNKLSLIEAMILGQIPQAEEHLVEAEGLARRNDVVSGLIELYTVRCNVCMSMADFGNASRYLTEAAQLGRTLDNKDTTAFGLAHKSNMLIHMTEYDQAWETAMEGLKAADEANNLERRAEILTASVPLYHLRNGDLSLARDVAEEGYRIATQIGSTYAAPLGGAVLGYVTQMLGDYESSLLWFERTLAHARPLIDFVPFMAVIPLGGLGGVCLDISPKLVDRVVEAHSEALKLLKIPSGAPAGGTGWADLGFCAFAMGEVDRADEYFQNGLTSPSIQMYEQRPRSLVGAALVALEKNRPDEASSFVSEARQFTRERGMKCFYPMVDLAEARLSAARGDTEGALSHYEEADKLAVEMLMRPAALQARMGMTSVLAGRGRTADAQAAHGSAQAMIDEIAAIFRDDNYRQMFVESATGRLQSVAGTAM
ncbi:MAG: adenylate/guanylate cyclase domain-containing protein [Chloroflexota bacterium]